MPAIISAPPPPAAAGPLLATPTGSPAMPIAEAGIAPTASFAVMLPETGLPLSAALLMPATSEANPDAAGRPNWAAFTLPSDPAADSTDPELLALLGTLLPTTTEPNTYLPLTGPVSASDLAWAGPLPATTTPLLIASADVAAPTPPLQAAPLETPATPSAQGVPAQGVPAVATPTTTTPQVQIPATSAMPVATEASAAAGAMGAVAAQAEPASMPSPAPAALPVNPGGTPPQGAAEKAQTAVDLALARAPLAAAAAAAPPVAQAPVRTPRAEFPGATTPLSEAAAATDTPTAAIPLAPTETAAAPATAAAPSPVVVTAPVALHTTSSVASESHDQRASQPTQLTQPAQAALASPPTRGADASPRDTGVPVFAEHLADAAHSSDEQAPTPAPAITSATPRTEAPSLTRSEPSPRSEANPAERVVAHQVSRAIIQHLPDGGTRMVMRLTPPELGTVRVEFLMRDGVISARLVAEDDGVRQALDRALPHLRNEVRAEHPSVDITVDRSDQRQSWQDGNPRHEQRHDQQASGERRPRADDERFTLDLDAAPADTPVYRAEQALGGRVSARSVDAFA